MWSAAYGVFLIACAACARGAGHYQTPLPARTKPPAGEKASRPSRTTIALWIALPACASAMLLATTNLITLDIAVVPLLWVLPLCMYLISFILCFQSDRWYKRGIFHTLYVVTFLLVLHELSVPFGSNVPVQVGSLCLVLFAVCMVCHGELARSKPASSQLSTFYFMLSAGGALGSGFVVFVAPRIFRDVGEFALALIVCGGLLLTVVILDKNSWFHQKRLYRGAALVSIVLLMLQGYRYEMAWIPLERGAVRLRARNFFGVKSVNEDGMATWLVHGNTLHGFQLKDPARRDEPTQYYNRLSGVGLLLENYPRPLNPAGQPRGLRVGVVGLGTGTLAAYGRAGDYFRFYEIDPQVADFSLSSSPVFTFLKDSRASVDVVMGDARLSLADEALHGQLQKFDVLVLDAFSSDSVPVHLLTKEAMALYLRHLSGPDGIIAFHLTNRSLDLRPVVAGLGREYNLAVGQVQEPFSRWVLVSANPQMFSLPGLREYARPLPVSKTVPLWTDEYSNLFQLLRNW
jgi:uncharacterized membrane protein YdcZ (DUF606 family)